MDANRSDDHLPADNARTEWLVRHEPWLRLLAHMEIDSRFQGKFSASDAVQQTMIEAWRGWDACRGQTAQERRAWLRAILAHQLAHLARHYAGTQKRDLAREVSLDTSLAQSSARLEQLLAGNQTSPSGVIEREEEQIRLAAALTRLPDDYRTVIIMRNLHDLPHAEVARRMQRSEGAVRTLWVRALARLRDELA